MWQRKSAFIAAVLVAGCGADELVATTSTKTTHEELPVKPKGTVSGQLLTTRLAPLAGATASLSVGSESAARTATTDANGNFVFADVPAGAQVLVTLSKDGHATLRATATVPVAAGGLPLANANATIGPFALAALDGTLRFSVFDPSGRPAAGAKATLEASPAGVTVDGDARVGVGVVVVDATSDASGSLVFQGIPSPRELAPLGGSYRLWVAGLEADGALRSGGHAETWEAEKLVEDATPRFVQLPALGAGSAALEVAGGNVASLRARADNDPLKNLIKPGDSMFIAFNQPVLAGSVLVRLTDEYARESLGTRVELRGAGTLLVVTPAETLREGQEYNLHVRAVSAGGSAFAATGFVFSGDPAAPLSIGVKDIRYQETSTATPSRLQTGERIYVNFNQPIARSGTASRKVQAFLAIDIDGDNKVGGETPGELGNTTGVGLDLSPDEPNRPVATRLPAEQPVFPIGSSGYTTRFSFVYPGSVTLDPGLVEVTVAFSRLANHTNDVYETMWGEPITADLKAGLQIIAPPEPTEP